MFLDWILDYEKRNSYKYNIRIIVNLKIGG